MIENRRGPKSIFDHLKKAYSEFQNKKLNRPFVVVSYAQSIDGCLAKERGMPYLISGNKSKLQTHQIRGFCDGILVGIGTVISDNPKLTTRYKQGSDPIPVLLDSELKCPPNASLFENPNKPILAALEGADSKKNTDLREKGAKILTFSRSPDKVNSNIPLKDLLSRLYIEHSISTIMVEGGARVISDFFEHKICDYIIITIAPIFIGTSKSAKLSLTNYLNIPKIKEVQSKHLDNDIVLWGKPEFLEDENLNTSISIRELSNCIQQDTCSSREMAK